MAKKPIYINFRYIIFVFAIFSSSFCKDRELITFAFCKETQNGICIPPVHIKEMRYTLHDVRSDGSLANTFNDLYFRGDTLAFHFIPDNHTKKHCNYSAYYTFPEPLSAEHFSTEASPKTNEPTQKKGQSNIDPQKTTPETARDKNNDLKNKKNNTKKKKQDTKFFEEKNETAEIIDITSQYPLPVGVEAPKGNKFEFQRFDCSEKSISGFNLLGSLYEIYFQKYLQMPYRPLPPLSVKYVITRENNIVVSRTIRLFPENLPE